MTITVYWQDSAQSIIRYDFPAIWTWDEFWAAFKLAYDMGGQVSHRIDIIVNLRESQIVPSNALTNLRAISEQQHAHARLSVIVTSVRFLHVLYGIGKTVYPKVQQHFVICETLEDAERIVVQSREQETLPQQV